MINSSHGNLSFLHFFISLISAIPIFISAPHFLIIDFSVAHFRSCCFCVFNHHFCSLPFVSEAMCVHKCWPSFLVYITCFFLVSLPSGRGEAWLQLLPPIRPPAEQLRLPLAPFGSFPPTAGTSSCKFKPNLFLSCSSGGTRPHPPLLLSLLLHVLLSFGSTFCSRGFQSKKLVLES